MWKFISLIIVFLFFGFLFWLIEYKNIIPEEVNVTSVGSIKFPTQNTSNNYYKIPELVNDVLKIKEDQFQIELHDFLKGVLYCDIKSIKHEQEYNNIFIDFDYRGITTLKLNNYNNKTREAHGVYKLFSFEVDVSLKFSSDGTANGKWSNMGKSGSFNIIKKIK